MLISESGDPLMAASARADIVARAAHLHHETTDDP